jgi:uncharacterized protein (DUF849 family)
MIGTGGTLSEDVLESPDATPARSNAQLVETAFEIVRAVRAAERS